LLPPFITVRKGYYGRIAGRSSLASKERITAVGRVIDSDYRGEVLVILMYHGHEPLRQKISKGQRCAQLILEKIATPPIAEVKALTPTVRGSTGL